MLAFRVVSLINEKKKEKEGRSKLPNNDNEIKKLITFFAIVLLLVR
jgi:hypothetical protein